MNHVAAEFICRQICGVSSGTPSIAFQVEASNNGEKWFDVTGLTRSITAPDNLANVETDFDYAFMRVRFTLDANSSSAGEWASATFCLSTNLLMR